jgi:hypothetical protein
MTNKKIRNMTYKITYHKDINNQPYYAMDIDRVTISKYITQLREEVVDLTLFNQLILNQSKRDSNKHHITVLNAINVGSLIKNMGEYEFIKIIKEIEGVDIVDLKILGLGASSVGNNISYYVVVVSDTIDEILSALGLSKKDLHITIGYDEKDVFDVPKNQLLIPRSKFLTNLAALFYSHDESFEFIRKIRGFNGNEDQIQATFIGESWASFKIGEFSYISLSLIDDKMMVTNSWSDKKKKRILAHTIVCRRLRNFK